MPVDIRIRFGRAIRRIREAQGNQEEAAERCGLHRTHYSGIERGLRNVSLVNVGKISKGLQTPTAENFQGCLIYDPVLLLAWCLRICSDKKVPFSKLQRHIWFVFPMRGLILSQHIAQGFTILFVLAETSILPWKE